jgi:hypothetical protein
MLKPVYYTDGPTFSLRKLLPWAIDDRKVTRQEKIESRPREKSTLLHDF